MKLNSFMLSLFAVCFSLMPRSEIAFIQDFDKGAYYAVISGKEIRKIDQELDRIRKMPIDEREAYEGALMAKKAGLMDKPKEKLNLFKAGRKKLEDAIRKDSTNTEWRFLRLMIQENTPKSLNYKKDLKGDSEFLKKNYASLSAPVKKIVVDYSKNSKVLKPADF